MKRVAALGGLLVGICALASAQSTTGDRVVVPARNTDRPRVVNAKTIYGPITVKTYNGKEVIVETERASNSDRKPDVVDGLKRIDIPRGGLEVEEENNIVKVRLSPANRSGLIISVPPDTSLQLESTHATITVDGVHGDIDAGTVHADIRMTNVSGTVSANTTHGNLKISMDRVDAGKPLSFSTVHGDIDVALPADARANVKMSSLQGEIYSDFEIRLTGGQPVTEKSDSPEGRFRIRMDRTITGTINGGGAEASFRTVHGRILLRKK